MTLQSHVALERALAASGTDTRVECRRPCDTRRVTRKFARVDNTSASLQQVGKRPHIDERICAISELVVFE